MTFEYISEHCADWMNAIFSKTTIIEEDSDWEAYSDADSKFSIESEESDNEDCGDQEVDHGRRKRAAVP